MIRKLYNRLHKKFYYSTSFHKIIAPKIKGQPVSSPKFSFYGKKLLSNLLQIKDFRIIDDVPGILRLQLGKIRVEIKSLEELYILNEIYIDGWYNFAVPSNQVIVVDIGMNVGFASLFFAQTHAVSRIYSFEPLAPTFDQALKNFSLNEETVKNKIIAKNYGLAASEKEEEWDYNYSQKGNIGVRSDFVTDASKLKIIAKERIKVTLKDATEILLTIFERHPLDAIILKIDCEGAEYEIIEKLSSKQMLSKINVLMIEWHVKGPQSIVDLLLKNNYSIISKFPHNKVAGMIYAFNKSNT